MRFKVRKIYPNENGRGVDKYLEKRFVPRLKNALAAKSSRTKSRFNVDVRYRQNDLEINLQET
jgi:hypothetical protein